MSNLNPQQFTPDNEWEWNARKRPKSYFHGTDADLKPGESVLPGALVGRTNFPPGGMSVSDPEVVYLTGHPQHAWEYARSAGEEGRGAPRVYQVKPVGRTRRVINNKSIEFHADEAVVIRSVTPEEVLPPEQAKKYRNTR